MRYNPVSRAASNDEPASQQCSTTVRLTYARFVGCGAVGLVSGWALRGDALGSGAGEGGVGRVASEVRHARQIVGLDTQVEITRVGWRCRRGQPAGGIVESPRHDPAGLLDRLDPPSASWIR